ncbi:MAG: UDPGP type 1 family protein [Calditrichaeota bacterium]|nr:UDPGP type 1 family protein [Calditrichota bacterium]
MEKSYEKIRKKATNFGQEHVFRFWNELDEDERQSLCAQLERINFDLMQHLKEQYIDKKGHKIEIGDLKPIAAIPVPNTPEQISAMEKARQVGKQRIAAGKVAALLVAGGQGTRLGFHGPKGMYPICPMSQKTFFQLHAEKILSLRNKFGVSIPWYIMTSETNHRQTVDFFQRHNFFDLAKSDVIFFTQGMLPAMDENGKFFLDAKNHIFTNPNGHGGTLFALRDSNCLEDMAKRGIEDIFYFQVDNVLNKICDPVFIGYHHLQKSDMSSKVVEKRYPLEKVGVIGKRRGKVSVIEYSDMPEKDQRARDDSGKLKYRNGSIAIHVIDRKFIEKLTESNLSLPFHVAHKKITYLDEQGNEIEPAEANGYKFEMFIFDALPYAKNPVVMMVDRKEEFSPVKNKDGDENTPKTARRDLMNYYARMLQRAGYEVEFDEKNNVKGKIEISPLFAATPEDLRQKLGENFRFSGELYLH